MKKFIKMLSLLACLALMFSFTACDTETKAQMLTKVNEALAKTDSATLFDYSIETTMIVPEETINTSYAMKIANSSYGQRVYIREAISHETDEGSLEHVYEEYCADGYVCFVCDGEYVVTEDDSESHFETSPLFGLELTDSDIKSWSKSAKNGLTTYSFVLTSSEFFEINEMIVAYENVMTDLVVKLELAINGQGYASKIKVSASFMIEDNKYSIVSDVTFNALGSGVVINIPDEVAAAINEYIYEQESGDKPGDLPGGGDPID